MSEFIVNKIINEASLSRVQNHTANRNVGMISAFRGERSHAENEAAHKELAAHIRKAGYGYIKTHSGYVENKGTPQEKAVTEKSYMVIGHKGDDGGKLLGHLKKWGRQYNQDAILHKKYGENGIDAHGLKSDNPNIKEKENLGSWHPNRAGEYSSYLHKYKSDKSFEFGESAEYPNMIVIREVKFYSQPNNITRMALKLKEGEEVEI